MEFSLWVGERAKREMVGKRRLMAGDEFLFDNII